MPTPLLNHVPKCHIHPSLKYLQWRCLHPPVSELPALILDNSFYGEYFPIMQPKPSLVQLKATSFWLLTCYLGEEPKPHFLTASFQVVVESNMVLPEPFFLQTEQLQFPPTLLIRHFTNIFALVWTCSSTSKPNITLYIVMWYLH